MNARHRFRARALAIAGSALLAATPLAAPQQRTQSIDLVELDAVVVDRKGQPMTGLTQADFVLKEDGKPVEVTTFTEVSPVGVDPEDRARSIVLLLDEAGVSAVGTQTMQKIARAFLSSAQPLDEISVVRLHNQLDEPFGDRRVAEFRIDEYRGRRRPVQSMDDSRGDGATGCATSRSSWR